MMVLELEKGYFNGQPGVISYSSVFDEVGKEQVEEFDKQFPPKEKYRTKSQ